MTVVLTTHCVAKENTSQQPMPSFLIFPVKGKPRETALYDKGVIVTQQACGVVDGQRFVQNFIPKWKLWQATPGGCWYMILQPHRTKIAVVPGGLRPILQHIDTDVAFVFRHLWQAMGHEWETAHATTKLNAASYRILASKLCAAA